MAPGSEPVDHRALHDLADRGELIAYFGYGSLVNRLTHRTNIIHYERAGLAGFSRSWQERPDKADHPIALLTGAPDEHASGMLDGLLVFDHAANLAALDERESGYDRLEITSDQLALHDGGFELPACDLYVYSARTPANPDQPHYILQSYLDAVLQGYLHQYSRSGAAAFVERTKRFDTPVFTDRNTPLYPRAVMLSGEEQVLIDKLTGHLAFTDTME